jgi:hypothetical protein
MSDNDREVKTDKSGHVEKVLAPSDDPGLPEPTIDDPQPDRAPGGVDATTSESDVGSGDHSADELLVADQPLAAQTDEVDVPDAIQEGEDSDEPSSHDGADPKTSKPD